MIRIVSTIALSILYLCQGCSKKQDEQSPKDSATSQISDTLDESAVAAAEGADDLPAPLAADVLEAYQRVSARSERSCQDLVRASSDAELFAEAKIDRIPFEARGIVDSRLEDFQRGVRTLEMRLQQFEPRTLEEVAAFERNYESDLRSVQSLHEDVRDVMLGVGLFEELPN